MGAADELVGETIRDLESVDAAIYTSGRASHQVTFCSYVVRAAVGTNNPLTFAYHVTCDLRTVALLSNRTRLGAV